MVASEGMQGVAAFCSVNFKNDSVFENIKLFIGAFYPV